jgi:endonuclease G
MKNLGSNILVIFALLLLFFIPLVGCEGFSRYKQGGDVIQKKRDYSNPTIETKRESEVYENDDFNTYPSEINPYSLQELFKKYKPAVFIINTYNGVENFQGSGFFISPNGIGISNYHVFKGTQKGLERIKLESGEEFKISEIIEANEEYDYIIFKVGSYASKNYFRIAPVLSEVGEDVFSIGNPKGLEHTLSRGIISGYRGENKKIIQTTTEITHGSSGGPLINMKGEVIGITTSGFGEANLNFAINMNAILLPQDIKKKSLLIDSNQLLVATSTTGQIVNHNYYTVSYSEKDEQAEWVSYKVTKNNFINNIDRTNDYRVDPYVTTGSADPNDFEGSGYDMGHLAPAKIMSHNYTSMSESFYLSNISPQAPSFNRGIWKTLEGKIRYWVSDKDSIFVTTGPILDNPIGRIGKNNVTVPRAFYKTLLGYYNGKVEGLAFIIPNESTNKSIFKFVTSIDEVEKITGLDFYYNLDEESQKEFESNSDLKKWILKK